MVSATNLDNQLAMVATTPYLLLQINHAPIQPGDLILRVEVMDLLLAKYTPVMGVLAVVRGSKGLHAARYQGMAISTPSDV
jgi:hypothetical protein